MSITDIRKLIQRVFIHFIERSIYRITTRLYHTMLKTILNI